MSGASRLPSKSSRLSPKGKSADFLALPVRTGTAPDQPWMAAQSLVNARRPAPGSSGDSGLPGHTWIVAERSAPANRELAPAMNSTPSASRFRQRTCTRYSFSRSRDAPWHLIRISSSIIFSQILRRNSNGRSVRARSTSFAPELETFCTRQATRNLRPPNPILPEAKSGKRGSFLRSCTSILLNLRRQTGSPLSAQPRARPI